MNWGQAFDAASASPELFIAIFEDSHWERQYLLLGGPYCPESLLIKYATDYSDFHLCICALMNDKCPIEYVIAALIFPDENIRDIALEECARRI